MLNRRSDYSLAAGDPEASSDTHFSCGVFLGSLFPQAPEHLRFDSWPRHWSIGLKKGQNLKLSLPVRKLGFAKPLAKAKSPPATAMDGLVFGERQDAAFYRTTYTRFLKFFIYFLTSVRKQHLDVSIQMLFCSVCLYLSPHCFVMESSQIFCPDLVIV
ncbi:hypothetical protein [Sporolactobacillus inulinus]|uniref:hypothetical protein n=1 Tax=Sporolactobacillus inulinus TaxID=2078 RepID=UPI0021CCD984|nr:hypothetical protein [Sporolactobacillus inulinus]